jgi:hypothetical protein
MSDHFGGLTGGAAFPTETHIDAAAKFLRETQQGGKNLTPWPMTPNATKKKWLALAQGALVAAINAEAVN